MEQQRVAIWIGGVVLEATQVLPDCATGLAIIVSGLGSDERNRRVAEALAAQGIASLEVTLLSGEERQFDCRTGHFRYDADFLAHRLIEVVVWSQRRPQLTSLPIAYIGSTVGAAAALVAAAIRPDLVSAVVAINGRTDLAADYLRSVKTPTLFVLNDMPVLRMNRDALNQVRAEKRIEVLHAADETAMSLFVQKAVRWISERVGAVEVA